MVVLPIHLDRARSTPLAAQIYRALQEAIDTGRLASGARLPSWRDLAAQLGVSRGTVRSAYERLIDEQFAIGLGAAGTRVRRPAGGPAALPGGGGVGLDEGAGNRRLGRGDLASRVSIGRGYRFARPVVRYGAGPLSPWYMRSPPPRGLLLGVANLDERRLLADCRRLVELVR